MYDFGRFCYLDVQKTGSSFVGQLLKECSDLPILKFSGHKPLQGNGYANLFGLRDQPGHYRPETVYFNSIRNPFDYYASLYNYGCDNEGGIYQMLARSGHSALYDNTEEGFLRWMAFLMDPGNAHYFGKSYGHCQSGLLGFLTFRLLRLSMVAPIAKLHWIKTADDITRLYDTQNICQFTIRNEHMSVDIRSLIDNFLHDYIDETRTRVFLERDRINASKHRAASGSVLAASPLGDVIRKRDALVFEKFYPDTRG